MAKTLDRMVAVHSGRLIWLGEHWINVIRPEKTPSPGATVSLFHTRYSPAGEGNAALVRIGGDDGFHAVCADSDELGRFMTERFFQRVDYFKPDLPLVHARFARTGDIRRDPAWVIEAGGHRIVARWHAVRPPVVADGTFRSGTEHFTVLFFADEAAVELDGLPIDGQPFPRDIWEASIGGKRSSCVFALAETFLELPALNEEATALTLPPLSPGVFP